jgi:hypothetical protein
MPQNEGPALLAEFWRCVRHQGNHAIIGVFAGRTCRLWTGDADRIFDPKNLGGGFPQPMRQE